jgi:hypothetical protein
LVNWQAWPKKLGSHTNVYKSTDIAVFHTISTSAYVLP